MKSIRVTLGAALLAAATGVLAPAIAQGTPEPAPAAAANLAGLHDFDFQVGEWRVRHRVRGPGEGHPWSEFDGTCTNRSLMDGWANVEDNVFEKPTGVTRGVALRAYDPKTGQWAIWWVDGRDPFGALDPPVKGRFDRGVGTFYSDGKLDGKPIRVRFLWSHITPTSARWEQAYSSDVGNELDHGVPAGLVSLRPARGLGFEVSRPRAAAPRWPGQPSPFRRGAPRGGRSSLPRPCACRSAAATCP